MANSIFFSRYYTFCTFAMGTPKCKKICRWLAFEGFSPRLEIKKNGQLNKSPKLIVIWEFHQPSYIFSISKICWVVEMLAFTLFGKIGMIFSPQWSNNVVCVRTTIGIYVDVRSCKEWASLCIKLRDVWAPKICGYFKKPN